MMPDPGAAIVAATFNQTLQVWRVTLVDDGAGGQTEQWQQIADMPCRLAQPSDTAREIAEQAGVQLTHRAYADPTTDLRRGDQLRDGTGLVWRVWAVLGPSSPVYLRADLEQIQEGA
ncbi:head-tail adaptor protein [Actinocatenispora sera]|uniref:phage head completion protein n=1 Tax=Actinocatenispora sera TaxID=390989 RepID=UPI0033F80501